MLECGVRLTPVEGSDRVTATLETRKQFVWENDANQSVSYSQKLELPRMWAEDHPPQGVETYRCGLLYDKSALWSHVSVKVTKPPSFTITRVPAFGIPVVEGMTVMLSCDIEVEEELKAGLVYFLSIYRLTVLVITMFPMEFNIKVIQRGNRSRVFLKSF